MQTEFRMVVGIPFCTEHHRLWTKTQKIDELCRYSSHNFDLVYTITHFKTIQRSNLCSFAFFKNLHNEILTAHFK